MTNLARRALAEEDLSSVEVWFGEAETQRWLGDTTWPRRLLELARLPHRTTLLFTQADEPVALLDLERNGDGSASIAIVVAPNHRRRGIASAVVGSLFELDETEEVVVVVGEVEHGNLAGEGLLRAAGFVQTEGTSEGFTRYVLPVPRR